MRMHPHSLRLLFEVIPNNNARLTLASFTGLRREKKACYQLLVHAQIFSPVKLMSYNTEFISQKSYTKLYSQLQLETELYVCVTAIFLADRVSIAVVQLLVDFHQSQCQMGVACPHKLLSAFTLFRRLSFTLLQAVSLLLAQQAIYKGSYQRMLFDGLETFN